MAIARLKALRIRANEIQQQSDDVYGTIDLLAEKRAFRKRLKSDSYNAQQALHKHCQRLCNERPVMMKSLAKQYPFCRLEQSATSRAEADLMLLSMEIKFSEIGHKKGFPESLKAVKEQPKFGVSLVSLMDPWGRPFQYDVKGSNNNGKKSDVWSLGPPYSDPATSIIGN